ncbi:hypothetical protein BDR26DRAFT_848887 [Obelidium mucronatum]|nr:hypothetical protein BDR26DRAFT_848887 [Obelidium mucronatum]
MVLPLNTPQRIPWTVLMTVFYGICAGGSAYCYIKTYSFAKTTLSKAHVTVPRGNYDESFSAVYIAEPTVEAASGCYHNTATSIVATQDFDVTTIAKQEQIDPDSASILFHKSRVALQVWRSCAIMSFGIFVFYLPFVAAIYLELVFSEQETRQMVFDVAGTLAVLDVLWTPVAILYFQKEIRSSVCSLFLL